MTDKSKWPGPSNVHSTYQYPPFRGVLDIVDLELIKKDLATQSGQSNS